MQLKAAGLFKYVWPFCYHQALKVKILLSLLFVVVPSSSGNMQSQKMSWTHVLAYMSENEVYC